MFLAQVISPERLSPPPSPSPRPTPLWAIIYYYVIIIRGVIIVLFGIIWANKKPPVIYWGLVYSYLLEVTVLAGRVVVPSPLPLAVAGLANGGPRPSGH